MRIFQNFSFAAGINPIDTTGATADGTGFDTASLSGIGAVGVIVQIGNIAANASAFKLQESDDNSSWSDITGGGFTSPTAAGSDNKVWCAEVNMQGRKRYIRVTITGGAGATLVSAVMIGMRVGQTPNTDTERGVAQSIVL